MTTSNGSPPAVQPDPEPSASEPMSAQVLRPAGRRRNAEIGSGGGINAELLEACKEMFEAGKWAPGEHIQRWKALIAKAEGR